MKKNLYNCFVVAMLVSILFVLTSSLVNKNAKWVKFYYRTEALLDTICVYQPDYFLDVLCEQDVYCDFRESELEIKSLIEENYD